MTTSTPLVRLENDWLISILDENRRVILDSSVIRLSSLFSLLLFPHFLETAFSPHLLFLRQRWRPIDKFLKKWKLEVKKTRNCVLIIAKEERVDELDLE